MESLCHVGELQSFDSDHSDKAGRLCATYPSIFFSQMDVAYCYDRGCDGTTWRYVFHLVTIPGITVLYITWPAHYIELAGLRRNYFAQA